MQNKNRISESREVIKEDLMSTREVADFLKTSPKVVLENARKCLPDKIIENGKPTYWNKEEAAILIEQLKTSNPNQHTFTGAVKAVSTELTPSLRMIEAMRMFEAAAKEELERLKAENEKQKSLLIEQQPKVEFYDDVTGSKDTIDMKEVAKILNIKGIGRNKLFEILRNKHILDRNNQPYQKYVDAGYFRIIESRFNLPDGEIKISLKTVVFQKGLDFIRNNIKGA